MWQCWRGWPVVLAFLAGCTRDEDYIKAVRDQRAAWKEMTEILATIQDEQSMASAKKALDEKAPNFEAIAKRMKALPKPPPPAVAERLKDEEFLVNATLTQLAREAKRVSELPKGPEFLRQFESSSPGLFSAVRP